MARKNKAKHIMKTADLETRINRKMMELSNALSNLIELLEFPTEGKAALCPDTRHWKKEFLSSHLARVESSTCTNHHCGPGEGGV